MTTKEKNHLTKKEVNVIIGKIITYNTLRSPRWINKLKAVVFLTMYSKCTFLDLVRLERSDFKFSKSKVYFKSKGLIRIPCFVSRLVKTYFDSATPLSTAFGKEMDIARILKSLNRFSDNKLKLVDLTSVDVS